ncbi:hypothetical protein PspLS_04759 [Pyricularia sp. CBS 133598]|nr:hypothetical protein PspLS_04759 [Pyricularia sp. CBS 133598]
MPMMIGPARVLMGRLCMVLRTNQILKKICTHVQKNTRSNYCQGCNGPTIMRCRPAFCHRQATTGQATNLSKFCCPLFCECKFPFRRPLIACTSAAFSIRSDQQATSVSVGRFLQLSARGLLLRLPARQEVVSCNKKKYQGRLDLGWAHGAICNILRPSASRLLATPVVPAPKLPQDVHLLTLSSNPQSRSFSEINPPGHLFQHS